jgi:hypothetical protein
MGAPPLLCRHHGCELEIPLYPPYRFLNSDYSVFDCGSTAFSAANLKPLVRLCSSLPGEPALVENRDQWGSLFSRAANGGVQTLSP